jgi:7,8-dihydropterin-6-yl-methyl-4-(beta-D-ribofuranosyl)aminobenzene 5'-phosphate synthase
VNGGVRFKERRSALKTRFTIVCENAAGVPFGVIGEHGFACYVETSGRNYLFDTGQRLGIVRNTTALKKDLRTIGAIMISHGHYDHTGGLPAVLQIKGSVDVYAHPDIFIDRIWSKKEQKRFIGMPYSRSYLEGLGAHFRLGNEWVEVGPGVFLTGEIPRQSPFEKGDANMTAVLPGGASIHPDPLKDDLSLAVDTEKGLVLVLGCAHAGMINIIEYVLSKMNRDRVYAVIGGTHLGFSSEEQFAETLKVLDRYRIAHIGVSHCTGPEKAARMHARFGERFFFGNVGAVLEA